MSWKVTVGRGEKIKITKGKKGCHMVFTQNHCSISIDGLGQLNSANMRLEKMCASAIAEPISHKPFLVL
jgi:hypothetical protein